MPSTAGCRISPPAPPSAASRSATIRGILDEIKAGWTAGAGLEYAFLGNWSAKLEYLYADLGTSICDLASARRRSNVNFPANIVRAGLNYKFSGPFFSRY